MKRKLHVFYKSTWIDLMIYIVMQKPYSRFFIQSQLHISLLFRMILVIQGLWF